MLKVLEYSVFVLAANQWTHLNVSTPLPAPGVMYPSSMAVTFSTALDINRYDSRTVAGLLARQVRPSRPASARPLPNLKLNLVLLAGFSPSSRFMPGYIENLKASENLPRGFVSIHLIFVFRTLADSNTLSPILPQALRALCFPLCFVSILKYVCVCVCVFIKLHITAQSGPVIYSFYATVCNPPGGYLS